MNEVSVIKEGWLHKRGKGLLLPTGLCHTHTHTPHLLTPFLAAGTPRGRGAGASQPQESASEPRLPGPGQYLLKPISWTPSALVWAGELGLCLWANHQAYLNTPHEPTGQTAVAAFMISFTAPF